MILFELGEANKGCKLSAHQMHAEMLRKFPSRFDVPSISEIMAGISDLTLHSKKGTKPGKKGRRRLEDRFPDQFGPLLVELERVHAAGQMMQEVEVVAWLTEKRPGCAGSDWPNTLDWPAKMGANVRTVLSRWKKEKKVATMATAASAAPAASAAAAAASP